MVKWLNPPLQAKVDYRGAENPGGPDIIISVPAKSGTTWTMNIVHQLRSGGDADMKDIYREVPWAEFRERPDQPDEELLERWKALPTDVPRAFKTHAGPGSPFFQFRDDLKYIVIMRNPEEAMVSFKIFIEKHNPAAWEFFGFKDGEYQAMLFRDTFETWYSEVSLPFSPPGQDVPGGFQTMFFWSFLAGWWPHRNKPNVLMLHFSEMKKDHEGTIRRIADFLGFKPTAEQWPKILEYTSFPWMKAHGDKFRAWTESSPVPLLLDDAMVRKGAVGDAKADGMTPEIAADMRKWAEKIVQDKVAIDWMYNAGPIPPDA